MEVKYRWSFLIGDEPCTLINRPPPKKSTLQLEEVVEEQEEEEEEDGEKVEVVIEEAEEEEEKVEEEEKADVEATKVCKAKKLMTGWEGQKKEGCVCCVVEHGNRQGCSEVTNNLQVIYVQFLLAIKLCCRNVSLGVSSW